MTKLPPGYVHPQEAALLVCDGAAERLKRAHAELAEAEDAFIDAMAEARLIDVQVTTVAHRTGIPRGRLYRMLDRG